MPIKIALFSSIVSACAATGPLDCPPNTLCSAPPSQALQWAVELVPPTSAPQAAQERATVSFDSQGRATLELLPRIRIQGTVLTPEGTPITAQVVLARRSLIPGRPEVLVQTTTDEKGRFFTGIVQSSEPYSCLVLPHPPDSLHYPPASWSIVADHDQSLSLELATGQLLPIYVTDPQGAAVTGIRVLAIDATTGEVRSTIATAPDPKGYYALYLPTKVQPKLRVMVVPDGKVPLPTLYRDIDLTLALPLELPLPPFSSAQTFSLPIVGPSGELVSGARVDLSTDLTASDVTHATYGVSSLSDVHGIATVSLLPGTKQVDRIYTLRITPPAGSPFASMTLAKLTIGPQSSPLPPIPLTRRATVTGRIITPDGSAAGATQVLAKRSHLHPPPPCPANHCPDSLPMVTADSEGQFQLLLDPGNYDFELLPPGMRPRWTLDDRTISQDLALGTLALPLGALTRVTVIDPNGKPQSGTSVRIFSVAYDPNCQENECPLPARLRGDGTTDGAGVASVLLPSP